ncbi:glycosyltransferase family 39 protein [Actinomycetospora termitidis]|uniref:Glycosyltransferase family 39 protein n=1 Tax=Actinomycetospora termitidis TaxID=3053470 RepID=A0ABT7M5F5_9PSEU|nr:glycosyltransferase family 39 protein [Actinomycetospora sp. Odt1-22]MDL5155903.1 glycosyltransferase family 39 protein [Actinomycetospora sp. Odt1-22]
MALKETLATAPEAAGPRFAWRPVAAIAALVAVGHLVSASLTSGYWLDEAYMLAIGRHHLDWGSVDQPPLVPALAWLMDTVAPGSELPLRVPVILVTTAAVVVAASIARELGGGRRAQVLTAAAQATGLFAAVFGHWLTPYAFEPLEWLVVFWLLVRWVRVRDDRLLLVLGVVLGIALMTKLQAALLAGVLLVAVAVFGPRELLARPRLWLGGVIALLLAAPTLVWQAVHGWPQLAMSSVVAREVELVYGGRPTVAWELIAFGGLLGVGLALAGLWFLVRDPGLRSYRFVGAGFVALYVLFVATEGRPYYLLGYLGVMAAVGAVGVERRGRTRTWPAWTAGVLAGVLAVAGLVVSPAFVSAAGDRDQVVAAAATFRAVPDTGRTALVGSSYVTAAYLDAYSDELGLAPAHSANRGYGYLDPPSETDTDVLYVGGDPDELRPYFRSVRSLGTPDGVPAWLLTDRTRPWASFWPGLRHLDIV